MSVCVCSIYQTMNLLHFTMFQLQFIYTWFITPFGNKIDIYFDALCSLCQYHKYYCSYRVCWCCWWCCCCFVADDVFVHFWHQFQLKPHHSIDLNAIVTTQHIFIYPHSTLLWNVVLSNRTSIYIMQTLIPTNQRKIIITPCIIIIVRVNRSEFSRNLLEKRRASKWLIF